jgi:hypothetical protein
MQKDGMTKKAIASPKPMSLSEAMGREKQPGLGTPHIGPSKVNDELKGGRGAKGGGKGGSGGVKSTAGYDVKTRVSFGSAAKKK